MADWLPHQYRPFSTNSIFFSSEDKIKYNFHNKMSLNNMLCFHIYIFLHTSLSKTSMTFPDRTVISLFQGLARPLTQTSPKKGSEVDIHLLSSPPASVHTASSQGQICLHSPFSSTACQSAKSTASLDTLPLVLDPTLLNKQQNPPQTPEQSFVPTEIQTAEESLAMSSTFPK